MFCEYLHFRPYLRFHICCDRYIYIYINYICALAWRIKHARNKVWNGANEIGFKRGHATSLQKNVYGS